MKRIYIILGSMLACIFLFYVEQVVEANYLIKTLIKIILFTGLPLIYIKWIIKDKVMINNNIDRGGVRLGILFGIASFIIVIVAYVILKDLIDMQGIARELESKSQITPANFILVGLYITFGNSFLEEFFFRGFIFLNLYKLGYKKSAYIYSSVLFALYHIGIFKTWFNIWLIGLAVLGLVIIGVIFNWLNTKSESFINSWIVHILADCAIILIGLRMFNII